jgi:hypothetical protein
MLNVVDHKKDELKIKIGDKNMKYYEHKLLVKEYKGYTYRLIDVDTEQEMRVFSRDFKKIDFIVGNLFKCNYVASGNLIQELDIIEEFLGDSSKTRVEICIDNFKIGDLIDNVPIFSIGTSYVKNGKKMAYAYFKSKFNR